MASPSSGTVKGRERRCGPPPDRVRSLGFGRIDLLGEQYVLLHPGLQLGEAVVAIRGLEAGHAAQPASINPLRSTFNEPLMKLGEAWWSITALQPLLIASSEQIRPL